MKQSGGKVAVFVDAANFEISLKSSSLWADYKKLLEFVKGYGEPVILRYYSPRFQTTGQDKFFTFIKKLGFKLVTKSIKVIRSAKSNKNKANFDVEIAFDSAVNIGKFNKLILLSGDSDFVYMVAQLQKKLVY